MYIRLSTAAPQEVAPGMSAALPTAMASARRGNLGIHQRGVQSEGGAVDGGSII